MSDFLQHNLNRMSGIRDLVSRRADRQSSEEEAEKQRRQNKLMQGLNMFSGKLSANKLADAKVLEADTGRQHDIDLLGERNQLAIDTEDRMKESYKDGSYTDPRSQRTYTWETPQEFEMAVSQMQADRAVALKDRGDDSKDTDIYGAFQNTLGELSMIFPTGGLDPSTLMYNKEWMLENKDDFRSAFNEFTSSKYSEAEKASLNRLLESYLNSYTIIPEEEPDVEEGGENLWQQMLDFLKGQEGNNTLVPPENKEVVANVGPLGGASIIGEGGQAGIRATAEKEIRQDFYETLGGIQSAKPPVHIGNVPQWDEMMRLLTGLPQNLSSQQMMEIDKKMERAEEGKIGRDELNEFLTFLKQMGGTTPSYNPTPTGTNVFGGL